MSTVPSTGLMKTLTQVHIIPLWSVLSSSQTFRSAPISELPIEPPTTADWNSHVRVASLSPPHGHWCEGLGPSQAHQNCAAPGPLGQLPRPSTSVDVHGPPTSSPTDHLHHLDHLQLPRDGWLMPPRCPSSRPLALASDGEPRREKATNTGRALAKNATKSTNFFQLGSRMAMALRLLRLTNSATCSSWHLSLLEHLHPNQTYHVTQKKDLNLTEKATSNLESSPGNRCCLLPETWKKWTMEWS